MWFIPLDLPQPLCPLVSGHIWTALEGAKGGSGAIGGRSGINEVVPTEVPAGG